MIIRAEDISTAEKIKNVVQQHKIDFFDFGCSRGGNIGYVHRKTQFQGMGFDISEKKLREADEAGYLVSDFNILEIPDEALVDYGFFSHILEHLNCLGEVRDFIRKSCRVCRKQVLIKQPYFDSDLFLFQLGLKSGYSHWRGHCMNLTTPVLFNLLTDLKKEFPFIDFVIYYNKPVIHSDFKKIFPIDADIDSIDYDVNVDLPKPKIGLPFPHFEQINIVIFLDGCDDSDLYTKISKPDVMMYDSRSGYVNKKIFINAFRRKTRLVGIHFRFKKRVIAILRRLRSVLRPGPKK